MKIVFFDIKSGKIIDDMDDYYFVMNNVVYSDNFQSCESQEATVSFEDFIVKVPSVGWRVE